jgi:hypothetical protein
MNKWLIAEWLCFYGRLKFKKLQTFVNRSRTFHLNICISMEHAHPSYAHIILEMSMIGTSSSQNFMAKSYTNV